MSSVDLAAARIISAIRDFDSTVISSMTVKYQSSKFKYTKNARKQRASVGASQEQALGWFSVLETDEPEFASEVVIAANNKLRQMGGSLGIDPEKLNNMKGSNLEKLNDELRQAEKKPSSRKSREKKEASEDVKVKFFSPARSGVEDLFNTMYSEYSDGLVKTLRLFTGQGFILFDGSSVSYESSIRPEAEEKDRRITEELNNLWKSHKPSKENFTAFEIIKEMEYGFTR